MSILYCMKYILSITFWSSSAGLEDLADAGEVDLVGHLVLVPHVSGLHRGEEELRYHNYTVPCPKKNLEDFADAANVDLVLGFALHRREEECPRVAVVGVAVSAEADCRGFCFQFSFLFLFFLLCLPISFISEKGSFEINWINMSHESLVNIDKYREKDIVLIEGKKSPKRFKFSN